MLGRSLVVLLTAALPLACGSVTVQKPKDVNCNQDGCQDSQGTGSSTGASTSAGAGVAPAYNPTATAEVSVTTTTVVHAAASSGAPAADRAAVIPPAQDAGPAFQYDPRQRPWRVAVDAAPAGYWLATRAEALGLLDAGALAAYHHTDVWTSTVEGSNAFFVDLDNGEAVAMAEDMPLAALYVRAEK